MTDLRRRFVDRSVHHLRAEYLPRVAAALVALGPDDLWWRPHERANSVGNLLMHLEGNVRQWLLSGLGGEPDNRRRSREFAATSGHDAASLLDALQETVEAACQLVASLDAAALLQTHRIQGFTVDGLEAVYHVVEHFSWHTGQIAYIAKLRGGPQHEVRFYDDDTLGEANAGQ